MTTQDSFEDISRANDAIARRAIAREMIRHEDKLRNERLGWLLTLNGFLFAALAFAWNADEATRLVFLLACLGLMIGLSAVAAMEISDKAITKLRKWGELQVEAGSDQIPIVGIHSNELPNWAQTFVPWVVLPWSLVAIWPAVFFVRWWPDSTGLLIAVCVVGAMVVALAIWLIVRKLTRTPG